MLRGAFEVILSADTFETLRPRTSLDSTIIAAAMELVDKQSCVRYGLGVSLDGEQSSIILNSNPFASWRTQIDQYRKEAGQDTLIFFCPLRNRTGHVTLLEINGVEEAIYHYDSNIPSDRRRKSQSSRVRDLVGVSLSEVTHGSQS